MLRTETKAIQVGSVQIGHQNKIVVQSMCNTPTKDVQKTVAQILALEEAGCEIIRVAILDEEDAQAIKAIQSHIHIPLVADIHFDYRLALLCIENGIDKIRLNPGNIGGQEQVHQVVVACKQHHIPIRIGINSGSLEKVMLEKYGHPTPEAMIESAKRHVAMLEAEDFQDICLSFKSSDAKLCIEAYRLAAQTFPYPLHLGVTEAGTLMTSSVKSSVALGVLLNEGLGDTIRVSINGDPVQEIQVAQQILRSLGLIHNVPNLIACPTCGRTQWDITPAVNEIEAYLKHVHKDITVAIMGCAVNGPGEAREADIAIAGGREEGLLIKKGQIIEKLPQDQIVERLKKEIDAFHKD